MTSKFELSIMEISRNHSNSTDGLPPPKEKIILSVVMLVITALFALVPFKLSKWTTRSSKWKKAVSMASCFSGGVFMAACILDLFPDVFEAVDKALDEIEKVYGVKIEYPVAGFVICMGFFLVLIVEQSVLACQSLWSISSLDQANLINDDDDLLEDHNVTNPIYGSSDDPTVISHSDTHHDHIDISQHSALRSYILLVALSFHSIFEGLAIGLQEELGALLNLFIAVIAHKSVMAFSLGMTLAQAKMKFLRYVFSVMIFAVASPIGILIGMGISDMEQSLGGIIVNGILQGITGGTFLYITFFEVLPHELNERKNRIMRLFFVFIGYFCICGLMLITE